VAVVVAELEIIQEYRHQELHKSKVDLVDTADLELLLFAINC
jgi:hypothetical protein